MSAPHAIPALTAAAAIGIILTARWAATLRSGHRQGASAARPPWRRTAPDRHAAASTEMPPAATALAEARWEAVRQAEEHVHRCWRQLGAESDQRD